MIFVPKNAASNFQITIPIVQRENFQTVTLSSTFYNFEWNIFAPSRRETDSWIFQFFSTYIQHKWTNVRRNNWCASMSRYVFHKTQRKRKSILKTVQYGHEHYCKWQTHFSLRETIALYSTPNWSNCVRFSIGISSRPIFLPRSVINYLLSSWAIFDFLILVAKFQRSGN